MGGGFLLGYAVAIFLSPSRMPLIMQLIDAIVCG
jgi:hypothetical protein